MFVWHSSSSSPSSSLITKITSLGRPVRPCNTSETTSQIVSSRWDVRRDPQDKFAPVGWPAASPDSGREGAPSRLHGDRIPARKEEQRVRMHPAITRAIFKADLHLICSHCHKSFHRQSYISECVLKMRPCIKSATCDMRSVWFALKWDF